MMSCTIPRSRNVEEGAASAILGQLVVLAVVKQNLSALPWTAGLCSVDFGTSRDFRNFTPITIVNGQMPAKGRESLAPFHAFF